MILYDFHCPIDDLQIDSEDVPLFYSGGMTPGSIPVGKHLHAAIDQELTCGNGHVFRVQGSLLVHREA